MAAGINLAVTGGQVVQLFHHINIGRFSSYRLPMTPKASPATIENLESNTFNQSKQGKGEKQF
jgi:hypothetical protein